MLMFKRISGLQARILLTIAALLVGCFLLFGALLLSVEKQNILEQTNQKNITSLRNIVQMLEMHYLQQQQHMSTAAALANQLAQQAVTDSLLVSMYSSYASFASPTLAKQVSAESGFDYSFYVEQGGGFVRVVSTEREVNGQETRSAIVSMRSPQVHTLKTRKDFVGRFFDGSGWSFALLRPLFTQAGKLKAFIAISRDLYDLPQLRATLLNNKLRTGTSTFVHNGNGEVVILPVTANERAGIGAYDMQYAIENKRGYLTYDEVSKAAGVQQKMQYFDYFEPYDLYLATIVNQADELAAPLRTQRNLLVVFCLIMLLALLWVLNNFVSGIAFQINRITRQLANLSKGRITSVAQYQRKDELGRVFKALNKLIERINISSSFAQEIGKGNFDQQFTAFGDDDMLGNSLLNMRLDLKQSAEDQRIRQWTAEGNALLSEVLRNNNSGIDVLADQFLYHLIKYLGAAMGALYIAEQEETEKYLQVVACFAYSRRKYLHKRINPGEGLVGQAWLERDTIYMNDVPKNYIKVNSGTGEVKPRSVLIVPLNLNNKIYGLVELAFLEDVPKYKRTFVEEIARALAASISSAIYNQRNTILLEESQRMMSSMQAQEEEIRQNMEELLATQEEVEKRESEARQEIKQLSQELAQCKEQLVHQQ